MTCRVLPAFLILGACHGGNTGGDDPIAGDDQPGADAGPVEPDAGADADPGVAPLRVCGDGSEAFTTIADAIAAVVDHGSIEVCAGVYAERLDVATKSVHITGAGAGSTILDAGGAGTALVVGGGHTVTLIGITVRGGMTTGLGGAIRCSDSTLRLVSSEVLASEADVGGGGLYGLRCTVDVYATRFEGNQAEEQGGAALLVESTGEIVDSQFSDNAADYGGALHLIDGSVAVRFSTLTGNHANVRGGAIYQQSDSPLEDSTLSGNTSGWTGGAIHVNERAPIMRRNVITMNDAEWEGGGLYLHVSNAVLIENQITYNTCLDDGGGLRIFESNVHLENNLIAFNQAIVGDGGAFKNSHLPGTFIDNQIIGNIADGAGGGIEFDNCSSVVRGGVIAGNDASIGGGIHAMLWPYNGGVIEDVRISGNNAWRGGGIYLEDNYQEVTLRRLLIEDNTAHQGAGVYTRGTPLHVSNSLVRSNHAGDVGPALFVDPSSAYPWTDECPCPPIDPPARVEFTVVHDNDGAAGQGVWIGAPDVTIDSSIFTGHTGNAVTIAEGLSAGWSYNDTYPATFAGMANPTGSNGNLATNPAFMAPDSGDFHLAETSACVDAGNPSITDADGSRADVGIYGGPHAP